MLFSMHYRYAAPQELDSVRGERREIRVVEPWRVIVDEKSDGDNVGFAATEAAGVAFH